MLSFRRRIVWAGLLLMVIDRNFENCYSEKPTVYLETDIYKTSRKISELQKVNSNILVKWYAHVLAGEQDTVEKLGK